MQRSPSSPCQPPTPEEIEALTERIAHWVPRASCASFDRDTACRREVPLRARAIVRFEVFGEIALELNRAGTVLAFNHLCLSAGRVELLDWC